MNLNKFKWVLLSITLLVGIFLRFYNLGHNPPSLTWDETAWGYNAYSLGVDGRDEFGKFLPLSYIESFGDFKPPMYAYLAVIPVKLLGLNEFSTRLPSAFFGALTILLSYFLTKRIFWKSKNSEGYALLTSLLLAISPWHIMLSRAAFEANVATFFLVLGILTFLISVQNKKWALIISAASFALSIYTFNTARVFAPLIILLLCIAFRRQLLSIKKQVLISAIVGFLIIFPIIGFLFSPQAALRFREVNIFSDGRPVEISNQNIKNNNGASWSKIIGNRRVYYALSFASHYFDNLSPPFLFGKGDGNPKFSIQSVGQMYIWEAIFLVLGVLFLIKKKEGNFWLPPLWLLIGIIPAATARETPHALRIETTLPMFQLLTAYGIANLISSVKHKTFGINFRNIAIFLIGGLAIFNFIYFFHELFYEYPYEYSSEWQYGYSESIAYAKSQESNYDYVQVTNTLGRPYIYYLFYTKTNPSDFRKTASIKRESFGFVKVTSFGKYRFPEEFKHVKENKRVLYINTPYNLPDGVKILKTFRLLNGEPVLVAYTL